MGELQALLLAAHFLKTERRDVTLLGSGERIFGHSLALHVYQNLSTVSLTSSSVVLAKKNHTFNAAASIVMLNLYGAVFCVMSTVVKSCLIERIKRACEILRKGRVCAEKVVLGRHPLLGKSRNYLWKMRKAEKNI